MICVDSCSSFGFGHSVIPSRVEESRCKLFKVTSRDVSTPLDMTNKLETVGNLRHFRLRERFALRDPLRHAAPLSFRAESRNLSNVE